MRLIAELISQGKQYEYMISVAQFPVFSPIPFAEKARKRRYSHHRQGTEHHHGRCDRHLFLQLSQLAQASHSVFVLDSSYTEKQTAFHERMDDDM